MATAWRESKPPDTAWRSPKGRSPAESVAEQDLAAEGRDQRIIRLPSGRPAVASMALRLQPNGRRIYAYLRWSVDGRTVEKYVGEVAEVDRLANVARAWRHAREHVDIQWANSAASPIRTGSWASTPAIRRVMQGNKGRDTQPEKSLRSAVHRLGLRYRVSARPLPSIRRSADLVFPKAKVAVFLDGCFWHGCPKHHRPSRANTDFWETKLARNKERDTETDELLTKAGWTVVRVWEHQDPLRAAGHIADVVARALRT